MLFYFMSGENWCIINLMRHNYEAAYRARERVEIYKKKTRHRTRGTACVLGALRTAVRKLLVK